MDEQRQRDEERRDDEGPDERPAEERPGTRAGVREPMMEAPVAPAGGWHSAVRERSWNPAKGDRSFGYGADETAAPEPGEPARETEKRPEAPLRPTDAEAPGE